MWHACVLTLRDLSSAFKGHREQRLLTSHLTRCEFLETTFDMNLHACRSIPSRFMSLNFCSGCIAYVIWFVVCFIGRR